VRPAYPILLDVSTRLCVIVGGGEVVARRATGLIDARASRVRVVSPERRAKFPDTVELVPERLDPAHLDDAGLVFAFHLNSTP